MSVSFTPLKSLDPWLVSQLKDSLSDSLFERLGRSLSIDQDRLKFSEYKIEGLTVKALAKDVALASYQATITGTYKGKEVPSPVQVVEVWVKRDGKWLQASYQETPLDKK